MGEPMIRAFLYTAIAMAVLGVILDTPTLLFLAGIMLVIGLLIDCAQQEKVSANG